MFLSSLQTRMPTIRDGVRGTSEQHQAARILTEGHQLGLQPTPGRGPMTLSGSGLNKPLGGQNPKSSVEDNTNG